MKFDLVLGCKPVAASNQYRMQDNYLGEKIVFFCKIYSFGIGSCNRLKKNILLFSNVIANEVFSKSILIYGNRRSCFFGKVFANEVFAKVIFSESIQNYVFKRPKFGKSIRSVLFAFFKKYSTFGIRTAVFSKCIR